MDSAQHYSVSGLVYHPPPSQSLPQHPISDSVHHQSFSQDISWRPQPDPPHPQSAQQSQPQMQSIMSHPQDHVQDYVPSSSQQSFIPRHPSDSFTNHPAASSVDPPTSAHSMSFDSQIESRIGPDRNLPRRRLRMHERVPSHGDLSDYATMSQAYAHSQNSSFVPQPQQGSRPHTPQQSVYQLPEQLSGQPSLSTPDAYHPRIDSLSRVPEWHNGFYPPAQSRSASGSTASASSNPRSASPALSVASALTSVSSSASAPNSFAPGLATHDGGPSAAATHTKAAIRKKRLFNQDRFNICKYADEHPGLKQEDIAARFGVERSTVSKILKQKARWLSVDPEENTYFSKLRPSKFPSLERRLEEWVKLASKAGKALTDSVLRQKARELGDEMGYTAEKFKASSGWLENFKHRHGIRRGVWHGDGTMVQQQRSFALGFVPTTSQVHHVDPPKVTTVRVIPAAQYTIHQPSPTPMEAHSLADQDMGIESEEEDANDGTMSLNGQVMQSSISLQQAWPQAEEQPNPSAEQSTSAAADAYYSPVQPQQFDFPEPEPPTEPEATEMPAGMPAAEPIAVPLNGDDSNGQQVYILPVMPEVLRPITPPTVHEAERALDKVCTWYAENMNTIGLDQDDYKFLMNIKYKVFQKANQSKYDLPFVNRGRTES